MLKFRKEYGADEFLAEDFEGKGFSEMIYMYGTDAVGRPIMMVDCPRIPWGTVDSDLLVKWMVFLLDQTFSGFGHITFSSIINGTGTTAYTMYQQAPFLRELAKRWTVGFPDRLGRLILTPTYRVTNWLFGVARKVLPATSIAKVDLVLEGEETSDVLDVWFTHAPGLRPVNWEGRANHMVGAPLSPAEAMRRQFGACIYLGRKACPAGYLPAIAAGEVHPGLEAVLEAKGQSYCLCRGIDDEARAWCATSTLLMEQGTAFTGKLAPGEADPVDTVGKAALAAAATDDEAEGPGGDTLGDLPPKSPVIPARIGRAMTMDEDTEYFDCDDDDDSDSNDSFFKVAALPGVVNPSVQRRVDDLTYSARQGILEEAFAILMETDAEDASLWTQTVEEAIWQQRIAREGEAEVAAEQDSDSSGEDASLMKRSAKAVGRRYQKCVGDGFRPLLPAPPLLPSPLSGARPHPAPLPTSARSPRAGTSTRAGGGKRTR